MGKWRVGFLAIIIVTLTWRTAPANAEAAFVQGHTAGGGVWHSHSFNSETQSDAIANALRNCNQKAFACYVVQQFNSTCFALAYATQGGFGYGFASGTPAANRAALHQCITANPYDRCNIVQSYCDTVNQQQVAYAKAQQQEEIDAYNRYQRDFSQCSDFDNEGACDRALSYSKSEGDRQRLEKWRSDIQTKKARAEEERRAATQLAQETRAYEQDLQGCRDGIADACTSALQSSRLVDNDKTFVTNKHEALTNKSLASHVADVSTGIVASVQKAPPDTQFLYLLGALIGGAIVLGLAAERKKSRALRRALEEPPLLSSRPLPSTARPPPLPGAATPSVELAQPAPDTLETSRALVIVEPPNEASVDLAPIDTPAALRALRLAHSYLAETANQDFSDAECAKSARTTLSLASRQLDIAHHADANAKLEVDDLLISQPRLRAQVLTQEALTWASEKLSKAAGIAERAVEADPTFAEAHSTLGLFHFHNRNKAAAISALQLALSLDPDDIETHKLLDRAENMGAAEIATFKATRAGVRVANTGIGVYNTGVRTWNVFAFLWNLIWLPVRIINRFFDFLTGANR